MKFSLNWLCEAADIAEKSQKDILEQLTMAGIEVESANHENSDTLVELSITPNRGDCLSILGLARELAAIRGNAFNYNIQEWQGEFGANSFAVSIENPKDCPHYVGCILEFTTISPTPELIQNRLQKSGIKIINPIVDITNYVMLELGQPLHAFDFDKLISHEKIHVRRAQAGEKLQLLNEQEVELQSNTLIIAGNHKPLAVAGVMGGLETAVTNRTRRIFLESAFFSPTVIAGRARQYGLVTDSAHRFERGVDPTLQASALRYAITLLSKMAPVKIGKWIEMPGDYHVAPRCINLMSHHVKKLLGVEISIPDVLQKLRPHLDFTHKGENEWNIQVKPHRSDLMIAEDIIEEIARIYGYQNIPGKPLCGALKVTSNTGPLDKNIQIKGVEEKNVNTSQLRQALVALGYSAVVTYSFGSKEMALHFADEAACIALKNPIAPELSVMRTSMLPGLINTVIYNQHRQQTRGKIMEVGLCFCRVNGQIKQVKKIAGIAWGLAEPEQWGMKKRMVDFYDVKGDLEDLLQLTNKPAQWETYTNNGLFHPGQCAQLKMGEHAMGVLGTLHPMVLQQYDLVGPVVAFEIDCSEIEHANIPTFATLSKYPEIRRDFAFMINDAVTGSEIERILDEVIATQRDWHIARNIFDVYKESSSAKQKSMAISLIMQHSGRTLQDEEVNAFCEQLLLKLQGLGAKLRS